MKEFCETVFREHEHQLLIQLSNIHIDRGTFGIWAGDVYMYIYMYICVYPITSAKDIVFLLVFVC